jgi:hypothetical protein
MRALRITQWEGSHETHESRKLKFLPWVAAPNKHDGLGFCYLKAEPEQEKIELFCAWKLMVDLAARAVKEQRGWLMRSGKPLTAADMAMMTSFPARIFDKAIQFFCRPEVGWLEEQEVPPETLELPLPTPRTAAPTAAPGKVPADSPASPAESRTISPTDRQTGSTGQTGSTEKNNKNVELRSVSDSGSSLAFLKKSTVQWAANNARKTELEAKPRPSWTPEDRAEWQKIRGELAKIGKKQRAGVFA